MVSKFQEKHRDIFPGIVKKMWDDKECYRGVCYEYLDRYWYEERYFKDNYILFVSEDKYEIDGFILGKVHEDNTVEVLYLYVLPYKRRSGIGRALKTKLVEWSRTRGYDEVFAINLYSNIKSLTMNNRIGHIMEHIDESYYRSVIELNTEEET